MRCEDAAQFLTTLFEPEDIILIRPIESWTDANGQRHAKTDWKRTEHIRVGVGHGPGWIHNPVMLAAKIAEYNATAEEERLNYYFGVCPRFRSAVEDRKAGKRWVFDKSFQIRTVRFLWFDIDGSDEEETKTAIAAAALPPPTVVTASGNGFHLYWKLDAPHVIDDAGEPQAIVEVWEDGKNGKATCFR